MKDDEPLDHFVTTTSDSTGWLTVAAKFCNRCPSSPAPPDGKLLLRCLKAAVALPHGLAC